MYTHTAAFHSVHRLAAGLLALVLAAGLALPPAFAEGGPAPSAAAVGGAGEITASAGPAASAPESAVSLPVSGEAENTPPPPGPGSDEVDPRQEEGFVRGEAENGSLPTLFAAKAVQTWMDVGATLDRAQWPQGSGTKSDPYQIASASQLGWFSYQVNVNKKGSLCAELITDINLAGKYWFPIGAVVTDSCEKYTWFSGHFNGNGFYINNMTIDLDVQGHLNNRTGTNAHVDALGLFGCVGMGGIVEQVMMRDVDISNSSENTISSASWCCMGAIVGEIYNGGTVSRCGLVSGRFNLRGAHNWLAAGGIAGDLHTSVTLENCFSRIDFSNAITGSGSNGVQIGGLFGRNASGNKAIVRSCYVASVFTGQPTSPIGGVLGAGVFTALYYEKRPQNQNDQSSTSGITALAEGSLAGSASFLAQLNAPYSNPIWYSDRRDLNDGYPLPAYQNDPSWNEIGMQADLAGRRPQGSGTAASPYQIGTATELAWFAYKVNTDHSNYGGAHIQLTADIDLSGYAEGLISQASDPAYMWQPIGQGYDIAAKGTPYSGVFDGQGHVIRNLRVAFGKPLFYGVSAKGDSLLGLFGYVDGAVIQNLLLDDVLLAAPTTAGSYRWLWAGAIAAVAANSVLENCGVQQCTFTSSGETKWDAELFGGLIGDIYHSSESFTLKNCFANVNMGTISSSVTFQDMGGLVARLLQGGLTMENCYAAGSLTHGSGLIAPPSAGAGPAVFRNNYYQNTLPADSQGVSKTLAELQSPAFLDALNAGQEPRVWYPPAPYGLSNQGMPVPLALYGSWHGIGRLAVPWRATRLIRAAAVPPTPTLSPPPSSSRALRTALIPTMPPTGPRASGCKITSTSPARVTAAPPRFPCPGSPSATATKTKAPASAA